MSPRSDEARLRAFHLTARQRSPFVCRSCPDRPSQPRWTTRAPRTHGSPRRLWPELHEDGYLLLIALKSQLVGEPDYAETLRAVVCVRPAE